MPLDPLGGRIEAPSDAAPYRNALTVTRNGGDTLPVIPTAFYLPGVLGAEDEDGAAERQYTQIITLTDREMRKAFSHLPDTPPLDGIRLVDAMVVKEKRATFSLTPGLDDARPRATGAISNLYLAGDWCDTGWPATMEGAVRSGYLAAAAVLLIIL